eukprot:3471188-Rhodomonas_salina.2
MEHTGSSQQTRVESNPLCDIRAATDCRPDGHAYAKSCNLSSEQRSPSMKLSSASLASSAVPKVPSTRCFQVVPRPTIPCGRNSNPSFFTDSHRDLGHWILAKNLSLSRQLTLQGSTTQLPLTDEPLASVSHCMRSALLWGDV